MVDETSSEYEGCVILILELPKKTTIVYIAYSLAQKSFLSGIPNFTSISILNLLFYCIIGRFLYIKIYALSLIAEL